MVARFLHTEEVTGSIPVTPTMNIDINHGGPLAFILGFGWGILLFLALFATLAVGLYWITEQIVNKIQKETGVARWKFIAWTTGIVGAIVLTSMGLFIKVASK